MDTLRAFANGRASRDRELMVFDWRKAAEIIRDRQPAYAAAGLESDWEWTGGTIYENGAPASEGGTYLSSTWAVPELEIDDERFPCWRPQSEVPEWGSDTFWPDEALAILKQPRMLT